MYVTVEQEVMNTQILLFANSCFARSDLYTSLIPVQVHECVIRIGTNTTCHRKNSYKVKQLGRNLSLFVCFFISSLHLFIWLLQMWLLECNWYEDAIVFMAHLCQGNVYVQWLLHEISVLSSWLLHPISRCELSGKVPTIFRAVLDTILKEFLIAYLKRAFEKLEQVSSREWPGRGWCPAAFDGLSIC